MKISIDIPEEGEYCNSQEWVCPLLVALNPDDCVCALGSILLESEPDNLIVNAYKKADTCPSILAQNLHMYNYLLSTLGYEIVERVSKQDNIIPGGIFCANQSSICSFITNMGLGYFCSRYNEQLGNLGEFIFKSIHCQCRSK